jgi:hypothetical protein
MANEDENVTISPLAFGEKCVGELKLLRKQSARCLSAAGATHWSGRIKFLGFVSMLFVSPHFCR